MIKVHKVEKKYWWVVSYSLLSALVSMAIVTIFRPWGQYEDTDDYLVLNGIYSDSQEETKTWSDLADEAQTSDLEDTYNSLQTAAIVFLIFNIISMLLYVATHVMLNLDNCGKFSKTLLTVIFYWLGFVFYLIGYIVFVTEANITFGEADKGVLDAEGELQKASAGTSAIIGLVIVLLSGIGVILHTYIWWRANAAMKLLNAGS
mmetsp:Transcript_13075/g.19060  ORF Transcript_13075/g.19060 Transcript_13075/m.19060 type:complete len:204 (+) Transcript_13075:69-680(+)